MARAAPNTRERLGPTPAPERQRLPDVLRGLALLGILVVNMELMSAPIEQGWSDLGRPIDRVADGIVIALFQGKFYLLFSALFGYGLALQMGRASAVRAELGPRYQRRMIGLLIIGALHAVFLFSGDILVTYALLGLLLFALRDWADRRLLVWAAGIFVVSTLLISAVVLGGTAAGDAGSFQDVEQVSLAYGEGSFGDIISQRLRDLVLIAAFLPVIQWPTTFAAFLVGLVAGRRGLLADPAAAAPFFRRSLLWALPIGLGGGVLAAFLSVSDSSSLMVALAFVLQVATAPALSLAYVCLLGLWLARPRSSPVWDLAADAGRASLSVYLGQSLLAGLVFLSYGLGLFDQLGPAITTPLAIVITLLLALGARWWLARFRHGPAEWLLRSITYGRRMPLRRTAV